MQEIWLALETTAFPCACTALGAAVVFFLKRQPRPAAQRAMLGFAAGVMLAASVWSLLIPAIERAGQGGNSWLAPCLGFVAGAVGLLLLERAAGGLLAGGQGHSGRVVLAVTLHNLPEGMVMGLAAALAATGQGEAMAGAAALSMGIGLQNIPEGAAISLPMRQAGAGRGKSFAAGLASGLVEPAGAVIAACLASYVAQWMPWLLSAAAGAMVCVTAQEMIPEAAEEGRAGIVCIVLGFALMMALDVALGCGRDAQSFGAN